MKKLLLFITIIISTLSVNAQELNITFDTKSYTVDDSQKYKLEEYVDFLFTNPQLTVILEGHTDSQGESKDNMILSKNRAQTIKNYFISEGIIPSRVIVKACGETKPKAKNNTAENMQLNRRVEAKTFLTYE